jgi:hypothetical protein
MGRKYYYERTVEVQDWMLSTLGSWMSTFYFAISIKGTVWMASPWI